MTKGSKFTFGKDEMDWTHHGLHLEEIYFDHQQASLTATDLADGDGSDIGVSELASEDLQTNMSFLPPSGGYRSPLVP